MELFFIAKNHNSPADRAFEESRIEIITAFNNGAVKKRYHCLTFYSGVAHNRINKEMLDGSLNYCTTKLFLGAAF